MDLENAENGEEGKKKKSNGYVNCMRKLKLFWSLELSCDDDSLLFVSESRANFKLSILALDPIHVLIFWFSENAKFYVSTCLIYYYYY